MPWYWLNGLFHNPLRYPWYLYGKNTVFLLSVCVSSHISILSHQLPDNSCCSASPVALILNDLIKFQDVGDNNPRHPHKNPSVGFQFHAMRKRQPRVQSSCEESMRIFPGRRQSVSATMMQDAWMPPLVLIFFPPPVLNLYHQWNIWCRLSSFHCMSQLLKTTQIFHLFDLFIYFYSQTEHMTPAPLSLAIPNTMPSFRGKWVNQQWNEDELIMPHNLLWVTF